MLCQKFRKHLNLYRSNIPPIQYADSVKEKKREVEKESKIFQKLLYRLGNKTEQVNEPKKLINSKFQNQRKVKDQSAECFRMHMEILAANKIILRNIVPKATFKISLNRFRTMEENVGKDEPKLENQKSRDIIRNLQ